MTCYWSRQCQFWKEATYRLQHGGGFSIAQPCVSFLLLRRTRDESEPENFFAILNYAPPPPKFYSCGWPFTSQQVPNFTAHPPSSSSLDRSNLRKLYQKRTITIPVARAHRVQIVYYLWWPGKFMVKVFLFSGRNGKPTGEKNGMAAMLNFLRLLLFANRFRRRRWQEMEGRQGMVQEKNNKNFPKDKQTVWSAKRCRIQSRENINTCAPSSECVQRPAGCDIQVKLFSFCVLFFFFGFRNVTTPSKRPVVVLVTWTLGGANVYGEA